MCGCLAQLLLMVNCFQPGATLSNEQSETWTVSRVLQVVEGREQSLVGLEATHEVSEGLLTKDYRKYHEARQESARLMLEALGKPPPPPSTGPEPKPHPSAAVSASLLSRQGRPPALRSVRYP